MSQFGLPFDWPTEASKADYLVSGSNAHVVDQLDHWAQWPVRASLLIGPRKSGRSLLGRIFAANTGGQVVDDAEAKPEELIFHAWNVAQETRKPVLIIALESPLEWPVRLRDLKSRLGATPQISINDPDDDLLALLLQHCLGRRGIAIALDVARFIVTRMERSYLEVQRIVDELDQASLSAKRAITIPFAREHLVGKGLISP